MMLGLLGGTSAMAGVGMDSNGSSSSIPVKISVGPSLGILSGVVGFGGDVSVAIAPVSGMPLYVGLESGYYNWSQSASSSGYSQSGTISSVPLLFTGLYAFDLPNSSPLHPYVGLALGMSFTGASASGDFLSGSGSAVQFEGLLRPGVALDMGSNIDLAIEPKFGILSSSFVFLPHVDVVFGL